MTLHECVRAAIEACRPAWMFRAANEIAKAEPDVRRLIPAIEQARAEVRRRARWHLPDDVRQALRGAESALYRAHQAALDTYRGPMPCGNFES